jgi:hypothetical protein
MLDQLEPNMSSSIHPLRYLPEHAIEYLVREVYRLVNSLARRYYSNVTLLLSRQPDICDQRPDSANERGIPMRTRLRYKQLAGNKSR